MVPFGRYKGKPIEQMLADKLYALKQLQSEAVCLLYPEFVAVLQSRLFGLPEGGVAAAGVDVSASEKPSSAPERSVPKSLPSAYQMHFIYRWLIGFDTTARLRGRIVPPSRCRILIDWLDASQRIEFEAHSGLSWRDWNACYTRLSEAIDGEAEKG